MFCEDVKHAVISISSSGDNTIVAAPSGTSEFLAIDHINLVPNSAVTMTLYSGGTALSGTYSLTANQGFTIENNGQFPNGILKLGANEALIINLGSAVQCSGFVKYRIINR